MHFCDRLRKTKYLRGIPAVKKSSVSHSPRRNLVQFSKNADVYCGHMYAKNGFQFIPTFERREHEK